MAKKTTIRVALTPFETYALLRGSPSGLSKKSEQRWRGVLEAMLTPLMKEHKESVRTVLLPKRQSAQLLRDWSAICEVIYCYAVIRHHGDTYKGNTPRAKATEKMALKASQTALNRVEKTIDDYVATWKMGLSPVGLRAHGSGAVLPTTDEFATEVKARIQEQRKRVEYFLRWNLHLSKSKLTGPAKQGRPPTPKVYAMLVLMAYFRHHGWDDTVDPGSIFERLAIALFYRTGSIRKLGANTRTKLNEPSPLDSPVRGHMSSWEQLAEFSLMVMGDESNFEKT